MAGTSVAHPTTLPHGRNTLRAAEHAAPGTSESGADFLESVHIVVRRPPRVHMPMTAILLIAKRVIFVKPDGSPPTTRSGERAHSRAPPVLSALGDYDAMRLRSTKTDDVSIGF